MSGQKDRMLRGDLYQAHDSELQSDHRRARLLVEQFNVTGVDEAGRRRQLLDDLLGSVGLGTEIKPPIQCDYGYNIHVGARSFINYGAVMLDVVEIRIGDEVQIATGVQLLTATHPLEAAVRRAGWEYGEPVTIEDGAWLGAGVIVCPGVRVGENAVVGAGSIVTRDIPANVLAVGNPCRVVREIEEQQELEG